MKLSLFRKPYARFLIVWMFEFSPSPTALVMRWVKYVRTLSTCRLTVLAA